MLSDLLNSTDLANHPVASLSVELEDLRNGICNSCKKKLVSSNPSVPQITISTATGPDTPASVSSPLWRRVPQGGRPRPTTRTPPSIRPSLLPEVSPNTNKPPFVFSGPEVGHTLSSSQTTPTPISPYPNEDVIPPKEKPEPPKWSVVYNPRVERVLELHLAHVFKYDSPANCVKISPDGQRLAVAVLGNGKIYLKELKTGANIRLVSIKLLAFNIWIDAIDPSVFVDRYVKRRIAIWSVQFSPNGQLLATGAADAKIRVCSLKIRTFIDLIPFCLDLGHHR